MTFHFSQFFFKDVSPSGNGNISHVFFLKTTILAKKAPLFHKFSLCTWVRHSGNTKDFYPALWKTLLCVRRLISKAAGRNSPSPYPVNDLPLPYFSAMERLIRCLLKDVDNAQFLSTGVDRSNFYLEVSNPFLLLLPPLLSSRDNSEVVF